MTAPYVIHKTLVSSDIVFQIFNFQCYWSIVPLLLTILDASVGLFVTNTIEDYHHES